MEAQPLGVLLIGRGETKLQDALVETHCAGRQERASHTGATRKYSVAGTLYPVVGTVVLTATVLSAHQLQVCVVADLLVESQGLPQRSLPLYLALQLPGTLEELICL